MDERLILYGLTFTALFTSIDSPQPLPESGRGKGRVFNGGEYCCTTPITADRLTIEIVQSHGAVPATLLEVACYPLKLC